MSKLVHKGGAGKSTIAVNLAVALFDRFAGREGKVRLAFLDADALGVSSRWLSKVESAITVRRASSAADSDKAIVDLAREHDLIIADGPGGAAAQCVPLIRRASLVLVPIMASPLDMLAGLPDTRQLIQAMQQRYACSFIVRFLINGLDHRTSAAKEILETRSRFRPQTATAMKRIVLQNRLRGENRHSTQDAMNAAAEAWINANSK
jgi:cellulose biosynthesis protein BcsQ